MKRKEEKWRGKKRNEEERREMKRKEGRWRANKRNEEQTREMKSKQEKWRGKEKTMQKISIHGVNFQTLKDSDNISGMRTYLTGNSEIHKSISHINPTIHHVRPKEYLFMKWYKRLEICLSGQSVQHA